MRMPWKAHQLLAPTQIIIRFLCPPSFTVFKDNLAQYEVSKSAIKFPPDKPVPVELISAMSKFRATENLRKKIEKVTTDKAG